MIQNSSFEIAYNALSVGWHLRKIKEVDPSFLKDPKDWERFLGWLDRHDLTPKKDGKYGTSHSS